MIQTKAKLIKNIEVAPGYYKICLSCAIIARTAQPGQFLEVKVSVAAEPLLRRPFSIHRLNNATVEILFEVLGAGTKLLAEKKRGQYLDIIGPLGNGFDYRVQGAGCRVHLLVAGGMGVAPLFPLAEKIKSHKVTKSQNHKVLVLIGAKTKKQILCENEFKKLGCSVKIATDDGSKGFKGYVSDLLKKFLSTVNCQLSTIYACGPGPMLREVAAVAKKYNIPAQVSLEEHMACGIGACLGCVVNTQDGFKRVCKEGPVFDAKEIVWG
jgi:dihydroorotate dehydrogenase electron transfer subunit